MVTPASDVMFYACGHAIAQRYIDDTFAVDILGHSDESPDLCQRCISGESTPGDDGCMYKMAIIIILLRGR